MSQKQSEAPGEPEAWNTGPKVGVGAAPRDVPLGATLGQGTIGKTGGIIQRDLTRIEAIQYAMREENLDGLVCSLPANVLLLTGYWPVIGSALAIVIRNAPRD